MTRKFFLFFVFFFSFSLFWGQSIQPSLLENHRKKICLKGTQIPYSGTIAGYLYYRDLHPVHEVMFQIKNLILSVNYRYFDSIPSTPYIQGEVINGKEEGVWKFYQFQDSILLAESSFIQGKIDGKLIMYDVYNISEYQKFIYYYRKGKFLYSEFLY